MRWFCINSFYYSQNQITASCWSWKGSKRMCCNDHWIECVYCHFSGQFYYCCYSRKFTKQGTLSSAATHGELVTCELHNSSSFNFYASYTNESLRHAKWQWTTTWQDALNLARDIFVKLTGVNFLWKNCITYKQEIK